MLPAMERLPLRALGAVIVGVALGKISKTEADTVAIEECLKAGASILKSSGLGEGELAFVD